MLLLLEVRIVEEELWEEIWEEIGIVGMRELGKFRMIKFLFRKYLVNGLIDGFRDF